jgi:N utilization substance protein A
MGGLSEEVVERIIEQAEAKAEEAEQAAAAERRRLKEQERIERATAELEAVEGPDRAPIEVLESTADGVAEAVSPDTLDNSAEPNVAQELESDGQS